MRSNLSSFINYLTFEKGLSKHTISNYQRDINSFLDWFEQSELNKLDEKTIRYFIAHLSHKKIKASSTARKLSSLRNFFNYLIEQGQLSSNPAKHIKTPKKAKHLPKTLSVDQVNQFLDQKEILNAELDPLVIRDYAIIELFYSTGIRLSELTQIDCQDIEFADHQVSVLGKGNKERLAIIGDKASDAIKKWLAYRAEFIKIEAPCPALFLSKNGQRLTNRSIQLRIKKLAKQFNINVDLHPHMLRHSFASHMLQSSGDLRAVQELLGHASISSTQVYTHLDFQHLSKIYDQAHPRAKKPKK